MLYAVRPLLVLFIGESCTLKTTGRENVILTVSVSDEKYLLVKYDSVIFPNLMPPA